MSAFPLIRTPLFTARRVPCPALLPMVERARNILPTDGNVAALKLDLSRSGDSLGGLEAKDENIAYGIGELGYYTSPIGGYRMAVEIEDSPEADLSTICDTLLEQDMAAIEDFIHATLWVTPYGAWAWARPVFDNPGSLLEEMYCYTSIRPARAFRAKLGSDAGDPFSLQQRAEAYGVPAHIDHDEAIPDMIWLVPGDSNHALMADLGREDDIARIGWAIIENIYPEEASDLIRETRNAIRGRRNLRSERQQARDHRRDHVHRQCMPEPGASTITAELDKPGLLERDPKTWTVHEIKLDRRAYTSDLGLWSKKKR